MNKEDIIKKVRESDAKTDWSKNNRENERFLNENVNIRLEIDEVHHSDFQEPWANKYPDPKAYSTYYTLYYNSTALQRFILVSVDGTRARLPLPKSQDDLVVDPLSYKVAQIFDEKEKLDEYMKQSEISIRNEE